MRTSPLIDATVYLNDMVWEGGCNMGFSAYHLLFLVSQFLPFSNAQAERFSCDVSDRYGSLRLSIGEWFLGNTQSVEPATCFREEALSSRFAHDPYSDAHSKAAAVWASRLTISFIWFRRSVIILGLPCFPLVTYFCCCFFDGKMIAFDAS